MGEATPADVISAQMKLERRMYNVVGGFRKFESFRGLEFAVGTCSRRTVKRSFAHQVASYIQSFA
jgi:hypothetical protein